MVGRFTRTPRKRFCTLCANEDLGNELHFLLKCNDPQIISFRSKYIPAVFTVVLPQIRISLLWCTICQIIRFANHDSWISRAICVLFMGLFGSWSFHYYPNHDPDNRIFWTGLSIYLLYQFYLFIVLIVIYLFIYFIHPALMFQKSHVTWDWTKEVELKVRSGSIMLQDFTLR